MSLDGFYVPPPDYESPVEKAVARPPDPQPDYEDEELERRHAVPQQEEPAAIWDTTPSPDPLSHLTTMKRSHIRSIGVPVLPPIRGFGQSGVSLEDNRAFLRHLANHRNFDTVKSLRTCDDCPICRMVVAQHRNRLEEEDGDVILEVDEAAFDHEHHHYGGRHADSKHPGRRDVRELFTDDR